MNGSLTRLIDPDTTLRLKIVEFVSKGEFGLASGQKPDGAYERVWFGEMIGPDEVTFESDVFLLLKSKAETLKAPAGPSPEPEPQPGPEPEPELPPDTDPEPEPDADTRTFRITGDVPPEIWNRLGTRILPKLRSGSELTIGIQFSVTVNGDVAQNFEGEIRQILEDLGMADRMKLE